MVQVTKATYQDGVLKPAESLSLVDQQQVVIVIVPLQQDESLSQSKSSQAAILKDQARVWLSQQADDAVRPPTALEPNQEQTIIADAKSLLEEIRSQASRMTPSEIAADISQALTEARLLPADEQDYLEAELNALLRE
jgi:predicted DNA-binding antitoxin AbrB/MazE fold protein